MRRMLRWEGLRASLVRPTQAATQGSGVVLLVAIQHFDASSNAKALLAAATFIGLLASPLTVTLLARAAVPVSRGLAGLLALAGLGLAVAGLSSSFAGFLAGVLLGVPLIHASSPLVTSLWRQRVPTRLRGKLFSNVNSAAGVVGVASTLLMAAYLADDVGRYRPVMLALAGATVLAALAISRVPSRPLRQTGRNPLAGLALLWRHRLFGALSAVWMLTGLGNLATMPLRTEYLASGDHGFAYSAGLVLVLTTVIPQATALVATLAWGRLFDRVDFLALRLALNATFAASIVLFFGPSLAGQVLGSVLLGIGFGGGFIAWNLWVTKYAPPEQTADFMAVHTFLTGVRGLAAPFLAYRFLDVLPLVAVTRIGFGLVVTASLALVVLLGMTARNRPG